ncbi:Hypothetical predicted protein, partial [Paramuricea clavata]
LVERKILLAPCDSYNLDLHWTHIVQVITTNDYLTQTEYFTVYENITALRKC